MGRWLVCGCLLGFFLAGTAGCSGDSKPAGPGTPRSPRLPRPTGVDKKPDQGKKS